MEVKTHKSTLTLLNVLCVTVTLAQNSHRGVDCLVSPQTPTGGKQAAALLTLVGSLACVCLVVGLQHTQ